MLGSPPPHLHRAQWVAAVQWPSLPWYSSLGVIQPHQEAFQIGSAPPRNHGEGKGFTHNWDHTKRGLNIVESV